MAVTFDSKCINIDGTTLSFSEVKENPDNFLQMARTIFRNSTMVQKESESYIEYLKRLFRLAFYNKHLGVENTNLNKHDNSSDKDADCLLSTLGIAVANRCCKTSKIAFKDSGNVYSISNEELLKLTDAIKSSSKYTRVPIDIKFGVELEFIGYNSEHALRRFNSAMTSLVGADAYSAELHYRHNSGSKWMLGTDGSLSSREPCYMGYELTSPILSLSSEKDLALLKQVIEFVYVYLDGHPNRTCGTHIHISFDVPEVTRDLCKHLATVYKNSEVSLYDKLVPKRRRENNSRYCLSVDPNNTDMRFRKLNFNNVKYNTKSLHLEFRQLNGTLDYNKIIAWAKLQKMFIEISMASVNKDLSELANGIELEKTICDDAFTSTDVETFLVMSSLVS